MQGGDCNEPNRTEPNRPNLTVVKQLERMKQNKLMGMAEDQERG